MPELYQSLLCRLREKIKNKNIWVSIDETCDSQNRNIANFVVGVLDSDNVSQPFLLNLADLDQVNHSTIAAYFNNSLTLLYPEGIFSFRSPFLVIFIISIPFFFLLKEYPITTFY